MLTALASPSVMQSAMLIKAIKGSNVGSKYFFTQEQLQSISNVLGDTEKGLTGSEIGHILQQCQLDDPSPTIIKRHRIFNVLAESQNKLQDGKYIIAFIHKAMKPALYLDKQDLFDFRLQKLNIALAFCGLELHEDGKLHKTKKVSTLEEANIRANKLRTELINRKVHEDVLKFCKAELLQDNYFHAVFEATKSIADKIREKSGLRDDGAELAKKAFALGNDNSPLLAINSLNTLSELSEQRGFMNLLIGLFGTFRNPLGHEAKIKWELKENDALDILSLASLVHRKLDKCCKYKA